MVKNQPAMQETGVQSLGWEDPLEKGMATHSSILAWRISWTEEPGGLQAVVRGIAESQTLSSSHCDFHRFSSCCYRKCPQGDSPFTPHLGSLGTGAQRKSSCRVVEESGMCQGLYLMLSCPSPAPQRNPKSSPNCTAKGAVVLRWGDSGRRLLVGTPPQEARRPGAMSKLFLPSSPTVVWVP